MDLPQKECTNRVRWDGARRGWYEVYFLKGNDEASRTAFWLRYTFTIPCQGDALAELWGIFFDADDPARSFAVKRREPLERLRWDDNRFRLDLGEAALWQNGCRGEIAVPQRGHRLAWELGFDSPGEPLVHFPYPRLYTLELPRTKVISPHPDARFDGWLEADGRRIELRGAPGAQTHIWGTQHAHRWAWGHCNAFTEESGAVWEGLDSQVKLGPLTSPPLKLFFLRTGGREYRFNQVRQWLANRSRWTLGEWQFEARGDGVRLTGEGTCAREQMVGVGYRDPDGSPLWCANTKIGSLRLALSDDGGRELTRLTAEGTCALEFVERRLPAGVAVWL